MSKILTAKELITLSDSENIKIITYKKQKIGCWCYGPLENIFLSEFESYYEIAWMDKDGPASIAVKSMDEEINKSQDINTSSYSYTVELVDEQNTNSS